MPIRSLHQNIFMHNIREMIRLPLCFFAFALVALLCFERVIQAKVLKWLLLSLRFAFSGPCDRALFSARCNSITITANNYFKCMWIDPFSLWFCVFCDVSFMFSHLQRMTKRIKYHLSRVFFLSISIAAWWAFFEDRCTWIMGICFPCWGFAFVLYVITALNLELVNL